MLSLLLLLFEFEKMLDNINTVCFISEKQKSYFRRHSLPLNATGSGNEQTTPSSIHVRRPWGNLVVLVDTEGQGFVHLAAKVCSQSLESGNVFDLQVMFADAAVQHRVVVELFEKRLEDVRDAQPRQEVPLRDGLVQTDRDVALVPRGRDGTGLCDWLFLVNSQCNLYLVYYYWTPFFFKATKTTFLVFPEFHIFSLNISSCWVWTQT